jgi:prevent-host-death family protein
MGPFRCRAIPPAGTRDKEKKPFFSTWVPPTRVVMRLLVVTIYGYNVVMTMVRIADLKARLSEHLRSVRKGRTVTVLDRDTPVARIVPYTTEPIEVRRATRRLRDLTLPPRPASPTDSLAILLDDRRRR